MSDEGNYCSIIAILKYVQRPSQRMRKILKRKYAPASTKFANGWEERSKCGQDKMLLVVDPTPSAAVFSSVSLFFSLWRPPVGTAEHQLTGSMYRAGLLPSFISSESDSLDWAAFSRILLVGKELQRIESTSFCHCLCGPFTRFHWNVKFCNFHQAAVNLTGFLIFHQIHLVFTFFHCGVGYVIVLKMLIDFYLAWFKFT